MFETLFKFSGTIARHRDGPFAAERERYLAHCADGGGTETTRRVKAACILWVAERMAPADAGRVAPSRLREIVDGHSPAVARSTAGNLISSARPWLKYLGWWYEPKAPIPFEEDLDRFVAWMRDERGLTPCTVDQWRYRTANFLRWCADAGRDLAALRPEDIDSYFVTYGAQRWSRLSAGHIAKMLRIFLRHTAASGGCSIHLADSIQSHRRYALESLPYALDWDDVRRLIAATCEDTEADMRDRAILLLMSVYGLRRGEVAALRVDQIDREAGLLNVWRLKRRQPQVYPLVESVSQALVKYVDQARPDVAHAEVFIRLQAPREPITAPGLYNVVNRRLRALGVQAEHLGESARDLWRLQPLRRWSHEQVEQVLT